MKNPSILFLMLIFLSCKIDNKKDIAVMFRGDAPHNATYPNPPIDTLHGIKWKIKIDGNVFSSPAIYKGVAFVGGTNNFHAIDAKSGLEIWSIPVDGPANSSPAVYGNMVYFGDFSGKIYAIDAVKGAVKWTFFEKGERKFGAKGLHGMMPKDQYMTDDWDFFNSSPVITEDKLFVGSGNGNIYALELKTGEKIWSFKTGDVVHSSPAVAYDNVYVGSWDSYFYCLDAETGETKWAYKTGIDTVNYNQVGIQSSPVIADSMVYFGCRDAHVYALNAFTGELQWKKFNNYSWVIASPVLDEKNLYYTTSDSYQFIALKKNTGDSLYSLPTKGFGFSSPIRVNNMIYFGVFNGELVAINTNTKQEQWRFRTDEAKEDKMKVLNEDGTLNAQKVFADFSAEKMPDILNQMFSVGAILSSPVPYENTLIFGTADGYIYSIY